MFRFTNILNGLKTLYLNDDLLNKVMKSLPKPWKQMSPVYKEVQDLKTLPLDHLLGSLITHEMIGEDPAKRRKTLYLKPQ